MTGTAGKQTKLRAGRLTDSASLAELFRKEAEYARELAAYYQLEDGYDWESHVRAKLLQRARGIIVAEKDKEATLSGYIEVRVARYPGTKIPRRWKAWFQRRHRVHKTTPVQPFVTGVIEGLFVIEACRRNGAGTALVESGLRWLSNKGVSRVELGVLTGKEGAQAFWERFGFAGYRILMCRRLAPAYHQPTQP